MRSPVEPSSPERRGDTLTLAELLFYANADERARGFLMQPFTTEAAIAQFALVMTECAEAIECLRQEASPKATWESEDGKPEGLQYEMADILIRTASLAGWMGIELTLPQAVILKMTYNSGRPQRNGGKLL